MKVAILPCNGLDKQHGVLAREFALRLMEIEGAEMICPVLLNNSPARYEKSLADASLVVVDGCGTRCASKLALKLGLKVDQKMLMSDEVKNAGLELGQSLRPDPLGMKLIEDLAEAMRAPGEAQVQETASEGFDTPTDFVTVTYDKFVFKIPTEHYLFNENDCWVRVSGDRARVGVSDFVQQHMTDIVYFQPAEVGKVVEQFDEVGSLESGKSMMDALSPVSGRIVAVNSQLVDSPEWVNEDPYGKGWLAEIELGDFESDKELLVGSAAYAKIVEKKAAEALQQP